MKASDLLKALKATYDEPTATAKVKDAIAKGTATDDLGLTKGPASAFKTQLLGAGLPEDLAQAEVVEAIAKGLVTDDLAVADVDRITKAVDAAKADLAKAQTDLAAAQAEGDEPEVLNTEGADPEVLAKGFQAVATATADATDRIVKAFAANQTAQAKGLDALLTTVGEIGKSVAKLTGEVALMKGGVAKVEDQLAQPVRPRHLAVVASPYDDKTAGGGSTMDTLTKGLALAEGGTLAPSESAALLSAVNGGDLATVNKYLTKAAA